MKRMYEYDENKEQCHSYIISEWTGALDACEHWQEMKAMDRTE